MKRHDGLSEALLDSRFQENRPLTTHPVRPHRRLSVLVTELAIGDGEVAPPQVATSDDTRCNLWKLRRT